ncbi:MAG TPA: helix-turn-helix domain-containing protein [Candidatus Omnitrophota bacterium]|nr:helix-turn-helix domain-containing protein [Candidatus Omnitrophota bacterium]
MPEKLLTIEELAEYLGISEDKVNVLVKEGVISGYKVGGEFLRFRKDQIDAIRSEISSSISDNDRIPSQIVRSKVKERHNAVINFKNNSLTDRVLDFFYFYDFYLISSVIIAVLVIIIFNSK